MTRRFLFQIHWFLGITAGLVLAVMGVTGGLMSFEDEISEALSPRLYAPGVPANADLTPDRVIARLEHDNPGFYVSRLDWEADRAQSLGVRLNKAEGEGRKEGRVDRATGAWLGAPVGHGFFETVEALHRWLALPGGGNGVGRQITAFSAIALIFFALSGLYLRWPRRASDVRSWFVLDLKKSGRNLWRALHVVIGTWVMLFYLLSALTGLWWSYDWYRRGAVYALTGKAAERVEEKRDKDAAPVPHAAIDPAWAAFRRDTGDAYAWVRITQPKPGTPVKAIIFDARPADARHDRQTDRYSFDSRTTVLKTRDLYDRRPLGIIITQSMLELHRGAFFGLPGRIIMLLTSLTMPLFTVTGYLLYLSRRKRKRTGAADTGLAAIDGAGDLLIAYASQTGGAEIRARNAAIAFGRGGRPARLVPLSQLTPEMLADATTLLFIVSTYGEGEAPDMARGFERRMMRAPLSLGHLAYGLLAMGDREYPDFCAFGTRVDAWLAESQARALFPMITMDHDDMQAAARWHAELQRLGASEASRGQQESAFQSWALVARKPLNGDSPHATAFHLLLEPTDGVMLPWEAGDIVEVQPRNDPHLVDAWMKELEADGDVLEDIATIREQLAVAMLPAPDARPLDAGKVSTLRQLPKREYSAASIPADGTLDLVVRQVAGPDGTLGIGSGWLTAHMPIGSSVALRVRPNPGFRAEGAAPLILIGNGTGIAGLRAHLSSRGHDQTLGQWLLFGERNRAHDAYFDAELQSWLADGTLGRLDRAFSRDPDCGRYVQDLLRENGNDIAAWIEQGANIMVCGSLEGMADGVHTALTSILGSDRLDDLMEARRYKRDVY